MERSEELPPEVRAAIEQHVAGWQEATTPILCAGLNANARELLGRGLSPETVAASLSVAVSATVPVLLTDLWRLTGMVAAAQIAVEAAMEGVRELERRLGVQLHRPVTDEAPTAVTAEASGVNSN